MMDQTHPSPLDSGRPPGPFQLGELTTLGQEILCGQTLVDWLTGRPMHRRDWPWWDSFDQPDGYEEYLAFYHDQVRIPVPPPVDLPDQPARTRYLAELGPPHHLPEYENVDHRMVVGGPDEHTLLHGPPGTGKTWAALYIIKALQIPTIYVATEGVPAVARRMNLMGGMDHVRLVGHPDQTQIKTLAQDTERQLIVIDVLAPLMDDENSAQSWVQADRFLKPITAEKAALWVHHQGKEQARGPRGTSAILAAMSYDYSCEIRHDPTQIDIRWGVKDRGGHHPKGIRLTLEKDPGFHLAAHNLPNTKPSQSDTEITPTHLKIAQAAAAKRAGARADGTPYLPSENKVAEALRDTLPGLGWQTARQAIRQAIGQHLTQVPGAARAGYAGLDKADPE